MTINMIQIWNYVHLTFQNLNKFTTVFRIASLDLECWNAAKEFAEEGGKAGAGVSVIYCI